VLDYNFPVCGTNFTQDEFQYVEFPLIEAYKYEQGRLGEQVQLDKEVWGVDKSGNGVAIVLFPGKGNYVAFMQYTPFVYAVAQVTIIDNAYIQRPFSPVGNMAQLTITVFDQNGRSVPANVEVDFPGWMNAADPYEMLTNNSGQVIISCFSRGPNVPFIRNKLLISINDPTYGCFNDYATVPENGSSIQIQIKPSACGQ